ncbi:AGAP004689-PA [Anopheles gambiae str. PEST]|uniref:AGAP004689-PA n=2 Tax=gambiae species complex TaxID=44542 RepID=A7UUV8_ANOGA|nr:plexin domain-containing protein 2 isoform X1 [Anopheles gambiae]XP_040223802.2 plexin domain-containing protein 2 isoform X1 [Anopheles coluzzii]EDO63523.1 AGAP004689-PA [Anopheles gambiae str. PEST]
MMRMMLIIRGSISWLICLSLLQLCVCVKVPRKYLQSDPAEIGISSVVPLASGNGNGNTNESGTGDMPFNRSILPLDENKKSMSKQKLYQENLNGKKGHSMTAAASLNFNGETTHLLGFNGTGQKKVFPNDEESANKSVFPSPTKLGAVGLNTSLIADSSTRDPISDAINIDTIERTETELNSTLQEHNITKTFEDNHLYYKSTWSTDKTMSEEFWKKISTNLTVNMLLSNSHRRATTMILSFDFPFYGFPIRNVTIASGGFLYTGDYVHSWLASTQYIAPLMANFDTALSNNSFVKYRDDGETFTVVWENVILQDRPSNGTFTFSVTLNKSGDIVFAYKKIPISIQHIFENPLMKNHPVKIGLSDAYIIDKTIMRTKQKTIYEYHRVNFGQTEVTNDTIITLTSLPTCFSFKDCESCITHEGADFECLWCPTMNRCSTGTDRKRQDWVHKGCEATTISEILYCPALGQKGNNYGESMDVTSKITDRYNSTSSIRDNYQPAQDDKLHQNTNGVAQNGSYIHNGSKKEEFVNKAHLYHTTDMDSGSSNKLIVSLLVIILIMLICGCWVLYAYRNPHTKSGQLLIRIFKWKKYRPNKWLWRRGEARYTAASIHM